MVVYTVSYPPRLIPVSLVLPSLDDQPGSAPGPAPMAAPASPTLNQVVKVLTGLPAIYHEHLIFVTDSVRHLCSLRVVQPASIFVWKLLKLFKTWKAISALRKHGIVSLSSLESRPDLRGSMVLTTLGSALQ